MKVWVVRKEWLDVKTKMRFHKTKTKAFAKKADALAFYLEKTNGWSEMCQVNVVGGKANKKDGAK
jgi:hypothetical protein